MHADDRAAPDGADWGKPLVRLDTAWQLLESRLCAAVLAAEVAALALWVFLRGLASDYFPGENTSGLICRSLLSAAALGVIANLASRNRGVAIHRAAVSAAMFLGLLAGRGWAHAGVVWSSNLLNWMQNASVFMLIGGLRGLVTRLTFWIAFLGASLATSRAKHIHIDVLLRYVPAKLRVPTAVIGWLGAAVVCLVAFCGFVDYIAIAQYQATATVPCPADANAVCDAPVSDKLGVVAKETAADLFLLGRQASLDLRSLPRVVAGTPYETWMGAKEWNAWIDDADWTGHFDKAAVDAQKIDASDPSATHVPAVEVPGRGGEARGLLVRELDLIFPFGLLIIGLKFLLRIAILLSGNIHLDAVADLDEDALLRAEKRDEAAAQEAGL
jgi:Tripartite ATP-independent periplasmic transporters, DctQ component